MPYYVHEREIKTDQEQVARVAMFAKQDAIAVMVPGESVSFIPNAAEHQAWRDREYRRLFGDANGQREYQALPFATPWEHYAHRAKSDPEKVSYTPDSTYGHEDRRLVTTPVRYLEKYADIINYSRDQFAELAGRMRAGAMALQIADTADAIARVYCAPGSPTSCMDGQSFDITNTPVRAYAGGDLALAYLGKLGDYPSDDRVHARALVWRERKTWVRAYGDIDAMVAALTSAGYSKVSSWDGARLKAIRTGNDNRRYWVVPYIDGGIQRLGYDGGDYLVVGAGKIDGTNTSGASRDVPAHTCDRCSGECDEGDSYCESCLDNSFTCYQCNDLEFGDYYTLNDEQYCGSCFRAQRVNCAHCGDRYNSAESEDSEYCGSCADEITSCDHCNTRGHSDDLQLADHGYRADVCINCRRHMSRARVRPLHMVIHNGAITHSARVRWDSLIAWAERGY